MCVEPGLEKLVHRRVGALFVRRVEPGSFVRRRQSAGVGAGAFGCKLRELLGLPRRHVPTDGRRASGQKGSLLYFFSLGFFWGVCVCEASSVRIELE